MEANDYTVRVDQADEDSWTDMLPMFRDATIFQSWQHGVSRVGRSKISHLQLLQGQTIVAAAQIKLWQPPYLGFGIADIFRGPLWRRKSTIDSPELFQALIKELRNEYSIKRGLFLRIRSGECSKNKKTLTAMFEKEGFQKTNSSRITQTLQIDLQKPIDQIKSELKGRWRRHLNKTKNYEFHVTEGLDEKDYEQFVQVHSDMFQNREDVSLTDIKRYRNIIHQNKGRLYCLRLSFPVFIWLEYESFRLAAFVIPDNISFVFGKSFCRLV